MTHPVKIARIEPSLAQRDGGLESLLALVRRVTEDRSGGILEDALPHAIVGAGAIAGFAFVTVEDDVKLVCASGRLPAQEGSEEPPYRQAIAELALRAAHRRRRFHIRDLRHSRLEQEHRDALGSLDWRTLTAVPILDRRIPLGALVFAYMKQTGGERARLVYVDAVAQLLSLAMARQEKQDKERCQRDELAETARLAELGLISACVAHELRGPLNALDLQVGQEQKLVSELVRELERVPDEVRGTVTELQELIEDARSVVERLRNTSAQLLVMSRREPEWDEVDLSGMVAETLPIARATLQRRAIHLRHELAPRCMTLGSSNNLSQVVLNLVFNAADACEQSCDRRREVLVRTRRSQDAVELIVEDSGPGVDPKAVRHIFEPFFTTKGRGRGTGLGLKICSDVVNAHRGHIEVGRREGGGTRFTVFLPRSTEESTARAKLEGVDAATERTQAPARSRILIVEDDAILARTLKRVLRPHEVLTAASVAEAKTILLSSSFDPNLVTCDMSLSDGSGLTLHRAVAKTRPDLASRFVFMTGGGFTDEEASYLKRSGCDTLIKPVEPAQLLRRVSGGAFDTTAFVRTLSSPPVMPSR